MSDPRNSSNSGAAIPNPEVAIDLQEANAQYLLATEQQMPKGYKQTEVGVIPDDWEVSSIGAIASTSSGTTPPRALEDRYFKNGHIPWAKTLDLNNSEIRFTDERVTQAALDETSIQVFPVGSVLVAMYGGYNQIGRTGLLTVPSAINQALTAIQPDPRCLNSSYLLRVLNYRVNYWKTVASSSRKDPNITGKDVRDFLLAVPPKAEQAAIAEALSDADALIEALEQLVAKKRQLKQGSMQELLTGKRRLPGFSGEWEVRFLGDLCEKITTGKIDANAMMDGGEYPFFTCAKEHYWINEFAFDTEALLISGNGANVGYVHYYCGKFNAYQRTYVLTGFNCDIHYIKIFMERNLQDRIRVEVNAGSTPYILMGTLTEMHVSLPVDSDEQTAIAQILTDMDTEITELETKLTKARAVKQGMMQQLLTGKIRLL